MKNYRVNGIVGLASRLDRGPIASLLVRPDWPWALAQRPGVARVELSCATLRVRSASGVGPPIVFLIDPPNTVEHYDALIQILAQQARVVCVELPGFGFSTPGPTFDFGIQAYTLAIEELLRALKLEACTVVGSCVWAYTALALADRAPELVHSLVLTQSPCWADELRWSHRIDRRGIVRTPIVGQLAMYAGRTRAARRWYQSALPAGIDQQPYLEPALAALDHGSRFALGSLCQAWFRSGLPEFASVPQSARLIWGNADRSHRRSRAHSLREFLPNAECLTFEGCGHFPELEAPQRFAEVLSSLLESSANPPPVPLRETVEAPPLC